MVELRAQSAQILQDGEVDMVGAWNGRIQAAMKEKGAKGGPLAITFEQQMLCPIAGSFQKVRRTRILP